MNIIARKLQSLVIIVRWFHQLLECFTSLFTNKILVTIRVKVYINPLKTNHRLLYL